MNSSTSIKRKSLVDEEMDGIMKKKLTLITIVVLALVVSGCNMPGYEEATDQADDSMATEIAKILTGTPVQILISPTAQDSEAEPTAIEETEPAATETLKPEAETSTPTPTSTPTITPTVTLSDTDPVLTLGNPDWVDTMDDGDNWPTGFNQYTSIDFDGGYLKLTAETDLDGWRLSWPFLKDFYLEVKLQTPDCEGADHFGVMFRVPENTNANKGYLFGITCDGKYSLRRWDSQTMHFPINWTASDAIKTGGNVQNTLGIMAKGQNLTLYINGQKVKEITDNAYLEGSFGIFVGSDNLEDLTVWVDQVRYWENP